MISITSAGFQEQGGKPYQQDYIFPELASPNPASPLFIVNDGLGGHAGGEVASKLVADTLANHFLHHRQNLGNEEAIVRQFATCADILLAVGLNRPDIRHMATTVTMVHILENAIVAAHLGDSRIYHLRKGEVIWKTTDHTYRAEWESMGLEITEQLEADLGVGANAMHKAMHGLIVKDPEDDVLVPDVHRITDLQPQDVMLLCSDGVTNYLSEPQIARICCTPGKSPADRVTELCDVLRPMQGDNFSGYLLEVS